MNKADRELLAWMLETLPNQLENPNTSERFERARKQMVAGIHFMPHCTLEVLAYFVYGTEVDDDEH